MDYNYIMKKSVGTTATLIAVKSYKNYVAVLLFHNVERKLDQFVGERWYVCWFELNCSNLYVLVDPCMIDYAVRDNTFHANVRYEPRVV